MYVHRRGHGDTYRCTAVLAAVTPWMPNPGRDVTVADHGDRPTKLKVRTAPTSDDVTVTVPVTAVHC